MNKLKFVNKSFSKKNNIKQKSSILFNGQLGHSY